MMQPGIEPRSPRPLTNTLPTRPMRINENQHTQSYRMICRTECEISEYILMSNKTIGC